MLWKPHKLFACAIAIACSYKVSYAKAGNEEIRNNESWNIFSWFSSRSKNETNSSKTSRLLFWGGINNPLSPTSNQEETVSSNAANTLISRKWSLPKLARINCQDIHSVIYWNTSFILLSKQGDLMLYRVDDDKIVKLETGNVSFSGMALSPIGPKLLAWNQRGDLFEADMTESPIFTKTPKEWIGEHKIEQIYCGKNHCLACSKKGLALSWGLSDQFGQLGRGQITSKDECELPGVVVVPKDLRVRKVCCGDAHSALLMEDGSVWTCGSNQWLQLGNKEEPWKGTNESNPTPNRVEGIGQRVATDIACGANHTLILIKDGTVYSCGLGQWGQLGHHNYAHLSYLTRISWLDSLKNGRVRDIAAGSNHSCLVTTDGKLYSLGANFTGQLGNGSLQPSAIPRLVKGLDNFYVEKVFCFGDWTAVIGIVEEHTNG